MTFKRLELGGFACPVTALKGNEPYHLFRRMTRTGPKKQRAGRAVLTGAAAVVKQGVKRMGYDLPSPKSRLIPLTSWVLVNGLVI